MVCFVVPESSAQPGTGTTAVPASGHAPPLRQSRDRRARSPGGEATDQIRERPEQRLAVVVPIDPDHHAVATSDGVTATTSPQDVCDEGLVGTRKQSSGAVDPISSCLHLSAHNEALAIAPTKPVETETLTIDPV